MCHDGARLCNAGDRRRQGQGDDSTDKPAVSVCPNAVVAEATVANLESSAAEFCAFLLTWPCFCDLSQPLAIISCTPSPPQHRLNKQSLRFSTCCYAQQSLSSRRLECAVLPHLRCCVVSPCCRPPNSIASSPSKLHDSATPTSLFCKQPLFLRWHLAARHKARVIVPSGASPSTLTGAGQRLKARRSGIAWCWRVVGPGRGHTVKQHCGSSRGALRCV